MFFKTSPLILFLYYILTCVQHGNTEESDVLPHDILLTRQPYAYPEFTGNTIFKEIDDKPLSEEAKKKHHEITKYIKELFKAGKNGYCYKSADRSEEKCTDKWVIPKMIPISLTYDDVPALFHLSDVTFDRIENFLNPELSIASRKQVGRSEEINCERDLKPREDTWYYTDLYFEYDTLTVSAKYKLETSPENEATSATEGNIKVKFEKLKLTISIETILIDENNDFKCSPFTKDGVISRYPPNISHRPPEFNVDYDVQNLTTEEHSDEVEGYINHLKTLIMSDKDDIVRRIWLSVLPQLTDEVMVMAPGYDVLKILYQTVLDPTRKRRTGHLFSRSSN